MMQKDIEINKLHTLGLEMIGLVRKQIGKVGKSFEDRDVTLAQEVILIEDRVNALELNIDRVCEEILTLQQPLASDFRFVLSILKMNRELERIGDYAKDMCEYILHWEEDLDVSLYQKLQLPEMFAIADDMMAKIHDSLENDDQNQPRKVFQMDAGLNEIKEAAPGRIEEAILADNKKIKQSLNLLATVRKMERVGDQIKNIGEELIYYLEAKVVKHSK
ncbi:MAG: phosphate transport system protein [Flavobacteriales bacterium]|jgi:phosphate transport system protein